MADYGILIDPEWCTGCCSCEVACQMENGLPVGQFGIKVFEVGPWETAPDKWLLSYQPAFTDQCTMCLRRRKQGKVPSCVHHCQAKCMEYGPIEELQAKLKEKPKQLLYSLA